MRQEIITQTDHHYNGICHCMGFENVGVFDFAGFQGLQKSDENCKGSRSHWIRCRKSEIENPGGIGEKGGVGKVTDWSKSSDFSNSQNFQEKFLPGAANWKTVGKVETERANGALWKIRDAQEANAQKCPNDVGVSGRPDQKQWPIGSSEGGHAKGLPVQNVSGSETSNLYSQMNLDFFQSPPQRPPNNDRKWWLQSMAKQRSQGARKTTEGLLSGAPVSQGLWG